MKLPLCHCANFRDGNDQAEVWSDPSTEFDVNACGRKGHASITARVHGYWSMDVITLRIERKQDWIDDTATPTWEASLSHSSGGRLTRPDEKNYPEPHWKAVASDLDAEENFGVALIALSLLGKQILASYTHNMEAAYQTRRAELKAEREAARAAQAAAVAEDKPLGVISAINLMRQAEGTEQGTSVGIAVYERGETQARTMTVKRNRNISYVWAWNKISKTKARELLAQSSHRTYIP
jgi:hypothetical protein